MRLVLVVLTLLSFGSCKEKGKKVAVTAGSEQEFVLYLVRHAEKNTAQSTDDPALTPCGELRAQNLAVILKNAEITAVYSTNYKRTQQTTKPTANAQKLETIAYDPRNLDQIAMLVLETKKNALIVGHSTTTPELAGMLTGKKLEAMDEHIYNRLYKVVITDTRKTVEILEIGFDCVY